MKSTDQWPLCVKGAPRSGGGLFDFLVFKRYYNPSEFAYANPPPFTQGGLFVAPIITQIGRENKSSADIYMCIRRGDLRSPAGERSSPLPCVR